MNCCCTDGDPAHQTPSNVATTSWFRRIAAFIEWALPVTTLALVPKCPACVAAYVLLFTGFGLSVPAATAVRWTLIVFSLAALGYLLLRAARRALAQHATTGP